LFQLLSQLGVLTLHCLKLGLQSLQLTSLMLRFGGREFRRLFLNLLFHSQEFFFLVLEGEGSSGCATIEKHLHIPRFSASFGEFPFHHLSW
jgi:hypothetical protein